MMKPPVLNRSQIAAVLLGLILTSVQLGCTKGVTLSNQELKNLLAHARTSEDHLRLAAHYRAKAAAYASDAREHEELVAYYRDQVSLLMRGVVAEAHCQRAAMAAHDVATQLEALAADHESIAKSLDKRR